MSAVALQSRGARRFSWRIFWFVSLGAFLILGALTAVPQWLSKQARFNVLRSHVAEMAKAAASMVNGDLHRQLIEHYSPELYEQALEPLVRFHSAEPEIFYVYTMVERQGRTYFVLDTANSPHLKTPHTLRGSKYMEEFESISKEPDPDWLQRIARGETYVYPSFQHDEYGWFLSGHTPIFDSEGRYSGFVGVDFDTQYYLEQEAGFERITYGTLAAAFICSLIIGAFASRYYWSLKDRIREHYELSIRDELTQLYNRRGALAAARDALAANASSYALILVDVDDLKGINDRHGHAAGDDFLVRVADAMCSSVRDTDVCARLGGDEFLIFATGCTLDAATEIARRILANVFSSDAQTGLTFGVSIGICVSERSEAEFASMYRRADEALYRAKSAGRNRYVIYDPLAA
ncbi:MAG TPA: GGDEF domain-containing protein [Steroidobacteraceae bacterium]|nr:GGDEF domain-containing protein [Steroidobacteraceae bacterium]